MKKETKTPTNKQSKLSTIAALAYASAGIGLGVVTLISHLADRPKIPPTLGE